MPETEFSDKLESDSPGELPAAEFEAVERRFGVTLTIHDHRGILFGRDGKPYWPGRDHHTHPLCRFDRYRVPEWNRRCMAGCAFSAETEALRQLRPFVRSCWKGITELVVPVGRGGQLALIFYAGAFRLTDRPLPAELTGEARKLAEELPEADSVLFRELARHLTVVGRGVLALAEEARGTGDPPGSRKRLIRRYLDDHAHEAATLGALARELGVTSSRASHLVKAAFGIPFQELLMRERLERARNLLFSTALPLKEIALVSGLGNEFYFSRVFRRFYGMPPGKARRQ